MDDPVNPDGTGQWDNAARAGFCLEGELPYQAKLDLGRDPYRTWIFLLDFLVEVRALPYLSRVHVCNAVINSLKEVRDHR